jgi:hypothetical protein
VPKVEDAFRSLSRIRAPDLWDEVLAREPRLTPEGPSRIGRLAVAAVALAVFVGGFVVVATTFDRGDGEPASSVTTATPTAISTATQGPPSPPASRALPAAAGPIAPVLPLPGTSTSIAEGSDGIVFVSAPAGAARVVLRWDPSTDDLIQSEPLPGTQVVFAGGSVWAVGDHGRDASGTADAAAAYRLDPDSLAVAQTVDLPSVPGAVSPGPNETVWVGVEGEVMVLAGATGDVAARYDVEGTPTLLAVDPSGAHAYVVTDALAGRDGSLLIELDTATGAVIASAAVGVHELNGPTSLAATERGVWVDSPTGTAAHASLLAEGTLREVDAGRIADATMGSNAQAISAAGGAVWIADLGGMKCLDPASGALRDSFDIPTDDADLMGRSVVETSAGLLLDGSRYVLRLTPPAGCDVASPSPAA